MVVIYGGCVHGYGGHIHGFWWPCSGLLVAIFRAIMAMFRATEAIFRAMDPYELISCLGDGTHASEKALCSALTCTL